MTVCDLCSVNEACGTYIIRDSHPFRSIPTLMNLCSYCVHDLRENNVRLKRVKGMPINPIRIPANKTYSAEPKRRETR